MTTPPVALPLPPVITNTLSFRTIDYRRYLNTIEGDFDINSRLSIHAGYRYADRHIEIGSSDIKVGTPAVPTRVGKRSTTAPTRSSSGSRRSR